MWRIEIHAREGGARDFTYRKLAQNPERSGEPFFIGMHLPAVGIHVAENQALRVCLEMGEAEDRLAEGQLAVVVVQLAHTGAATAGKNEGGLEPVQLQVLNVVVVA